MVVFSVAFSGVEVVAAVEDARATGDDGGEGGLSSSSLGVADAEGGKDRLSH